MPEHDVPVLIVGGGPVGLAASLLLSEHGVDSLLVERNATTTDHPKAHIANTRTMEIFRALGVDAAVRAAALPPRAMSHVRWVRSLAGEELARLDACPPAEDSSPTRTVSCAQDRVEAILLAASASRRGRLRFSTELVALEPRADGVSARLRAADGAVETLRARFAIAADGASSGIRRQLGIGMNGLPEIATVVGTYFHADLSARFEARPALLYWVMNGAAPGTFIALDGATRWVFHVAIAEGAETPCEDDLVRTIRIAIGDPDVELDVKSIRPWRMTAQIAERYRHGPVLLAGDAAHRFPPTGGLGMNTGIQDVHNLAWKLARVLSGVSADALLDTYEEERRPVAQANSDFSVHNAMRGGSAVGPGARAAIAALDAGGPDVPAVLAQLRADVEVNRAHFGAPGIDLGFRYEAGALVPDGAPAPPSSAGRYLPSASSGARTPHVWLTRDGACISSLDLFGRDFVLLVAGRPDPWRAANAHEVAPGAPFDLEPGGALLVRPDGHVAWRATTAPAEPARALAAVLRDVTRSTA